MFARQLKKIASEPIDAGTKMKSEQPPLIDKLQRTWDASDARVAMRNSTL